MFYSVFVNNNPKVFKLKSDEQRHSFLSSGTTKKTVQSGFPLIKELAFSKTIKYLPKCASSNWDSSSPVSSIFFIQL